MAKKDNFMLLLSFFCKIDEFQWFQLATVTIFGLGMCMCVRHSLKPHVDLLGRNANKKEKQKKKKSFV